MSIAFGWKQITDLESIQSCGFVQQLSQFGRHFDAFSPFVLGRDQPPLQKVLATQSDQQKYFKSSNMAYKHCRIGLVSEKVSDRLRLSQCAPGAVFTHNHTLGFAFDKQKIFDSAILSIRFHENVLNTRYLSMTQMEFHEGGGPHSKGLSLNCPKETQTAILQFYICLKKSLHRQWNGLLASSQFTR